MASSRFPGKPLVEIAGVPLVVRSADRARQAGCFERVVVATEDPEIVDTVRRHGFEALLTPAFPTGTDRVAWAVQELGCPWAVNLQGDEPLFPLGLLRDIARALPSDPEALWTAADLALPEPDRLDPDVVKIVLEPSPDPERADSFRATDFHRLLQTAPADDHRVAVHLGLYAGSAAVFRRFAGLAPCRAELDRRIEPLRALEAQMPVRALVGKWNRVAVDRVEHISMVLDVLKQQGE